MFNIMGSFVVSNCEFATFPVVFWVRCGTWLYRFLIFAPLLTFYQNCTNFVAPLTKIATRAKNRFRMHLQMQRDAWLDNVINMRQYILWNIIANPTSLRNVVFHWFKSEYMQLASGFRQLASSDCRRSKVHFHCLFWRENVKRALECVAVKLYFRPYIWLYTSPNENFEYSYPLNNFKWH